MLEKNYFYRIILRTIKTLFLSLILLPLGVETAAREPLHARWNVRSLAEPGSNVRVGKNEFVESGWLRPTVMVQTSASIYDLDSGQIILPENSFLVQMFGDSQEFCTWNHGQELVTAKSKSRINLLSPGALLCVKIENEKTIKLHYLSSMRAILIDSSNFDFAGGAKNTNSVNVKFTHPDFYYEDVTFGPVLTNIKKSKKIIPCLTWMARVSGSMKKIPFGEEVCFTNENILQINGARYRLLNFDGNYAQIEIDKPFLFQDLHFKIIEKIRVFVIPNY